MTKSTKVATYKFVIDRRKKILRCFASGHFTKAKARAYIAEFIRLCATIEDIENYTLIVDAQEQELCTPDVLLLLVEVEDVYMSIPFKERRYVRLLKVDAQEQVLCAGGLRFLKKFTEESKEHFDVDEFIDVEESNLLFSTQYKELSHIYKVNKEKHFKSLNKNQKRSFLECESSSSNISLFFKRKLCHMLIKNKYTDKITLKQSMGK